MRAVPKKILRAVSAALAASMLCGAAGSRLTTVSAHRRAPHATAQAHTTAAKQSGQDVRPAAATIEPAGRILFTSERDGNYEIYVMNPDGGGQQRLTINDAIDREPTWSPDNSRLAFVSNRDGNNEIYVMSVSGDGFTTPTRLTNNTGDDLSPAWSPDGSKIAFTSSRDGNDEIYTMNPDGTGQIDISNNPFDDYDPAWSPDGLRFAFTSNRDGNEEIYTMTATGSGQTNLTNNLAEDRHPAWGGTRIAFQSARDGNDEIYTLSAADGSGQTRITNNAASDVEPSISSDGTRIAFASDRDGNFEVYVAAVNGSGPTRLTRNIDDNDFEVALQRQTAAAVVVAPTTVQFRSASFTAGEGVGSITVNVDRTGDTTGATTVDFDAATGSASERSDFVASTGTLRFAAGETTKAITIFITDDVFAEFDETANLTLSNPTGASLGTLSTSTLTITDNDAATGAVNPTDVNESFVRQQYIDFLGREPETEGFNAWLNVLRNCRPGDTTCDRIAVSTAFFGSPEFQLKGSFVIRFYLAAFGTLPTYREFVRDTQRITAPTGAEVIANQAAYTNEFALRADFVQRYAALSNADYVSLLVNTAAIAVANRDQLVADLNAGRKTRAQVLREIVESQAFVNKEQNRVFVATQYYGYLRRDPDPTGFAAWLAYLNTHPGDFRTMVNGFLNSVEYRLRFGPA